MSEEQRLVDLEIRAAYQDKVIEQLDEVVREFAERVQALERELGELKKSLDAPPIGPADEPPPHY